MEYTLNNIEVASLLQLRKNNINFNIKPFLIFLPFFSLSIILPISIMIWNIPTQSTSLLGLHVYHIITIVLVIFIIYIVTYFFFLRKYYLFTKDIKQRIGVIEEHEVINKQYFKHTNDYFIFLNDTNIPNVRVTAIDFEKFTIGGPYRIRRAKYSKVVLDDIERNQLNKDHVFENNGGRWRFGRY